MDNDSSIEWFNGVDQVVSDPLRFKKMLAIGEDAYAVLRLKNKAIEAWDIIGAAGTTASVAQSTVVASTFFAPSGWLSLLGIGTAATPIGWIIVAGVVGGGAWWGVTQYMKSADVFHVDIIPEFINTPLDALALGIFDLFAPLAIKIALFDGSISDTERALIKDHFVSEWGYDESFVIEGIRYAELKQSSKDKPKLNDLVENMSILTADNPDCNYKEINTKVVDFLKLLVEAEREGEEVKALAIKEAERVFKENDPDTWRNKLKRAYYKTASILKKPKVAITKSIQRIKNRNTTKL
jgi:hypothetical protein